MSSRNWMRTAALLFSPAHAATTLKNAMLWLRVSLNPAARGTLGTLFDHQYYLAAHPDIQQTGVHPYLHYLFRGFLEGRNPSGSLDTAHYLAAYPDVKRARMNPALHYALFGEREHRTRVPNTPVIVEEQAALPQVRIDNVWPANCPLVSVVIVCFNYGRYLEEALGSVLAQSFQNFEIIIVEGGSADGVTPRMVAGIEARADPKVRVLYRTERHLVGDNRNFGIAQARGRYICCLDADDALSPIYLEVALFLAEGYGYDLVSPSLRCFGDSSMEWILEDASFPAIAECNRVATTALFRRSAWAEVGGYRDWGLGNDYVPEDWEFWLRILGHGYRFKSIREPLMRYRVHGTGLMSSCTSDLEHQRAAIRNANRELFDHPRMAPEKIAVSIVNRWTNLIPEEVPRGASLQISGNFNATVTVPQGPATVRWEYPLPNLLPSTAHEEFIIYLLRRYAIDCIKDAGSDSLSQYLPRIRREFPALSIESQSS